MYGNAMQIIKFLILIFPRICKVVVAFSANLELHSVEIRTILATSHVPGTTRERFFGIGRYRDR